MRAFYCAHAAAQADCLIYPGQRILYPDRRGRARLFTHAAAKAASGTDLSCLGTRVRIGTRYYDLIRVLMQMNDPLGTRFDAKAAGTALITVNESRVPFTERDRAELTGIYTAAAGKAAKSTCPASIAVAGHIGSLIRKFLSGHCQFSSLS